LKKRLNPLKRNIRQMLEIVLESMKIKEAVVIDFIEEKRRE
jgi:hypothetical protein